MTLSGQSSDLTFLATALFAFLFGGAVGSFLNVCIYRLPLGKSIVFPASSCPLCGTPIRWHDNIPILGWLLLRGRCRACREPISPQYPLVEALCGGLTLALFLRFGPTLTFLSLWILCSSLIVITFIDLEHQIIPDVISLPGIVIGFLSSLALPWHSPLNSLIGILAGGGILLIVAYGYELLTKKEGMGGGDVKLLAMMGAFLGWRAVPFILFTASLFGSIIGVCLMLIQKKDSKLAIPFGPFLAVGALLFIFYGKDIINWYFGFLR